jgi:hypothetical protein
MCEPFDINIKIIRKRLESKRAIVFPIYKRGDGLVVSDYKSISLTSVVCKQMEHTIASYLRKTWDKKDWLLEGQHGFRPGNLCEKSNNHGFPGHCILTG